MWEGGWRMAAAGGGKVVMGTNGHRTYQSRMRSSICSVSTHCDVSSSSRVARSNVRCIRVWFALSSVANNASSRRISSSTLSPPPSPSLSLLPSPSMLPHCAPVSVPSSPSTTPPLPPLRGAHTQPFVPSTPSSKMAVAMHGSVRCGGGALVPLRHALCCPPPFTARFERRSGTAAAPAVAFGHRDRLVPRRLLSDAGMGGFVGPGCEAAAVGEVGEGEAADV